MDFDNPKVYGDTFISDGLVYQPIAIVLHGTKIAERGNMDNQKSDILHRKYSGWVAGDSCLGCCPKNVFWATSHRVIGHLQGQKSPIDYTTISTVAITDKDDI